MEGQEESFIVTEAAMRPASPRRECFYCSQPVGSEHDPSCTLIVKSVRIRATIEYDIIVPNRWGQGDVEWYRNESMCADRFISEMESISEENGCLCGKIHFDCLKTTSIAFLKEKS